MDEDKIIGTEEILDSSDDQIARPLTSKEKKYSFYADESFGDGQTAQATLDFLESAKADNGLSIFEAFTRNAKAGIYRNTAEGAGFSVNFPEMAAQLIGAEEIAENPDAPFLTPQQIKEKFNLDVPKPMQEREAIYHLRLKEFQEQADIDAAEAYETPVNTVAGFLGAASVSIGPTAYGLGWMLGKAGAWLGPKGAAAGAAVGAAAGAARGTIAAFKISQQIARAGKIAARTRAAQRAAQVAARTSKAASNAAGLLGKAAKHPFTIQATKGGVGNVIEEVGIHQVVSRYDRDYDLKSAAAIALFAPAALGGIFKAGGKALDVVGLKKALKKIRKAETKAGAKADPKKLSKAEFDEVKKVYKENNLEAPPKEAKLRNYYDDTKYIPKTTMKTPDIDSAVAVRRNLSDPEVATYAVMRDMNKYDTIGEYKVRLEEMAKTKGSNFKDSAWYKTAKAELDVHEYLNDITDGLFEKKLDLLVDLMRAQGVKIKMEEMLPYIRDLEAAKQRVRDIGIKDDADLPAMKGEEMVEKLFDVDPNTLAKYVNDHIDTPTPVTKRDADVSVGEGKASKSLDNKVKEDLDAASSSADEIVETLGDNGKEINKAIDDFVSCLTGNITEGE